MRGYIPFFVDFSLYECFFFVLNVLLITLWISKSRLFPIFNFVFYDLLRLFLLFSTITFLLFLSQAFSVSGVEHC